MVEVEGAHQVHYGSTREHQLLDERPSGLRFLERYVDFYLMHEGLISSWLPKWGTWYCGVQNSISGGDRDVEALRGLQVPSHDLVRGMR